MRLTLRRESEDLRKVIKGPPRIRICELDREPKVGEKQG
jgi:hypothetical protein